MGQRPKANISRLRAGIIARKADYNNVLNEDAKLHLWSIRQLSQIHAAYALIPRQG